MKILLANKFYYRRGGDCVHTLNLEQLLKAHGHEVAVFAMDYPENLKTQWSKYFPSEVKFKLGTGMIEAINCCALDTIVCGMGKRYVNPALQTSTRCWNINA